MNGMDRVITLTLVRPFFDHFACVIGSCINVGTGVYIYWNFTISPPFPLINLFCTSYKK